MSADKRDGDRAATRSGAASGDGDGAASSGGKRRAKGDAAPTWFARASVRVGRLIYRCVTRVDAEGLEDLRTEGPLILAANHLSNADPPLVACWLSPALGRTIRWMTKEEALRWPVLGWFMRSNGGFGVTRDTGDIEGFRRAKRILEAGEVLSVFPEGTRAPAAPSSERRTAPRSWRFAPARRSSRLRSGAARRCGRAASVCSVRAAGSTSRQGGR